MNANKLTKVDVSKNTNLRVLNVVGNRLKFSTMPLPNNNGKRFDRYSYNLQAPIMLSVLMVRLTSALKLL